MAESVVFIGEPTVLLWAAGFLGIGAIIMTLNFREFVLQQGEARAHLIVFGSVAFTLLFLIIYTVSHYPRVRLTEAGVHCAAWSFEVPWESLSDIKKSHLSKGSTDAVFELKPEFLDAMPLTDLVKQRRSVSCRIDSLDRSSDEALRTIRSYWSAATGRSL